MNVNETSTFYLLERYGEQLRLKLLVVCSKSILTLGSYVNVIQYTEYIWVLMQAESWLILLQGDQLQLLLLISL